MPGHHDGVDGLVQESGDEAAGEETRRGGDQQPEPRGIGPPHDRGSDRRGEGGRAQRTTRR